MTYDPTTHETRDDDDIPYGDRLLKGELLLFVLFAIVAPVIVLMLHTSL